MFDLITGTMERPLRERAPGSKITAIVVHVIVLTLVVVIPVLRVTNTLPDMQTMMAFTAEPPAPPPPPPPPPHRGRAGSRPPQPYARRIRDSRPCLAPAGLKMEATTGTRRAQG